MRKKRLNIMKNVFYKSFSELRYFFHLNTSEPLSFSIITSLSLYPNVHKFF
jgi:hypothetical protein